MFAIMLLALAALSASTDALLPQAAATCSSVPQCPAETGCVTTTTNGAKFLMQCDTDFDSTLLGTDQVASFEECADACSLESDCLAFNYKGRFCYFRGAPVGTGYPATDVMAGVLIQVPSTTPNACSTTCGDEITCDASSPTSCTYTNSGKTFVARCKVDFYGNDFAVAQSPDFTTCVQDCADSDRCLAVSFTGGNCYLKDAISQGEYSPAVTGAYAQQ